MSQICISNPDTLKTALKIALEVSFTDLSNYQTDNIKSFVNRLPNTMHPIHLDLSTDDRIDLVLCIRYFYQSTTYRWIRGNLSNALNDLEYQITNQQTQMRLIRDIG